MVPPAVPPGPTNTSCPIAIQLACASATCTEDPLAGIVKPAVVVVNALIPDAPVGPVGPVAPVAPAAPVAPVAPVGPVGPVGPVSPVAPCAPVAPALPEMKTPPKQNV